MLCIIYLHLWRLHTNDTAQETHSEVRWIGGWERPWSLEGLLLINSITYVLTENNGSTGTSSAVCDKYHLMPELKIEKG